MGSSNETSLLRAGEKSLGPRPRSGRLLAAARPRRWPRAWRRRPPAPTPAARSASRPRFRHHRPQAHLRRGVALRHDRVCLQPGPGRADGEKRRGPRAAAERHGRLRRARLDQPRAPGRGLHARAGQRRPQAERAKPLGGLRIGVPKEYFGEGLAPRRRRRRWKRRWRNSRSSARSASRSACPTPACRCRRIT